MDRLQTSYAFIIILILILLPTATPVAIPVTWPEGTYTLPRPKSGCPTGDFNWWDGKRVQDTESDAGNNDWSVGNHFDAVLKTDEFTLKYCTKVEVQPTEFDRKWPKGDYCIFKHGSCPADFEEGYVKWDDEDDTNNNDWDGVLPDGVYDEDTLQRYCCRWCKKDLSLVVTNSTSGHYDNGTSTQDFNLVYKGYHDKSRL